MNQRNPRLPMILTLAALGGGCGGTAATKDEDGAHLALSVAPLALSGVSDACYSLSVYAGTAPTSALVWSQARVCASQYGDAQGSVAYVGTCDATASDGTGLSLVRLVMEDLCSGGACGPTTPGPHSLAAESWRNPCRGPEGCTQIATCRANQDTRVDFDLVIARSAQQGFFDVAVSFEDIFCSAKLDCVDDQGGALELLSDPSDGGRRGPTVVLAWACTAGPGADTWLYFDNLVVTCFAPGGGVIGAWPYDPSLGPGNTGPGQAPMVFQSAVYRTVTQAGVASWNVALGIHPDDLPGRCVLTASATASGGRLPGDATAAGAIYPFVGWNVELSAAAGALSCTRHRLDEAGSGVASDYVRGLPRAFSHVMSAADLDVSTPGRKACSEVIEALDGTVSFVSSPEGVTARIGSRQSPFYRLPSDLQLDGCCGDPCCEAAP